MSRIKKLLLFIIFFSLGILFAQKKIIDINKLTLLPPTNKEFTQTQDKWEDSIEKTEVIISSNTVYKGVSVPKYWKYGVNTESTDYLEGYIPNIRSFKEYWSMTNNTLYGINPYNYVYTLEEIVTHVEKGFHYYVTEGIENDTDFFKWDSSVCKEHYSSKLESNIFLCENWINWLGIELKDQGYALVKCNINEKEGLCMFTDYILTYFNTESYGESRCFGENNLYCEYEKYIKIISLN